MRTIYLDTEFRCHVTDDGTRTPVQTDFFDNKCDALVEGYRCVPEGEIWVNPQGIPFPGEMIAPSTDFAPLDDAQRQHEREQLADMRHALEIMGVTV